MEFPQKKQANNRAEIWGHGTEVHWAGTSSTRMPLLLGRGTTQHIAMSFLIFCKDLRSKSFWGFQVEVSMIERKWVLGISIKAPTITVRWWLLKIPKQARYFIVQVQPAKNDTPRLWALGHLLMSGIWMSVPDGKVPRFCLESTGYRRFHLTRWVVSRLFYSEQQLVKLDSSSPKGRWNEQPVFGNNLDDHFLLG